MTPLQANGGGGLKKVLIVTQPFFFLKLFTVAFQKVTPSDLTGGSIEILSH